MEAHYNKIKKEYDDFYRFLLSKGRLPLWSTEKGFWNASVSDEVFELFKQIKLHNHKNFIDLGSGDGKVVMIASLFGLKATGIEYDEWLHNSALNFKKKFKDIPSMDKTSFINKDFHEHPLKGHDVVFIAPDTNISRELQQKLIDELDGKLVVYGPHFHPTALSHEETFDVGTKCSVYSKI